MRNLPSPINFNSRRIISNHWCTHVTRVTPDTTGSALVQSRGFCVNQCTLTVNTIFIDFC
jgi:hypothetical protein